MTPNAQSDEVDVQGLIRAWMEWDRRPSNRDTTYALEDKVQEISKQIGIKGSELHDMVNKFRSAGMRLHEAIELIV